MVDLLRVATHPTLHPCIQWYDLYSGMENCVPLSYIDDDARNNKSAILCAHQMPLLPGRLELLASIVLFAVSLFLKANKKVVSTIL